ncbi:MAG: hypothetical protein ACRDYF_02840 [Acidimicrobiia bacterium]
MEPELLLAQARLTTVPMTSGDSPARGSAADGTRSGMTVARFILGCVAIAITVAAIATALVR